LCCVRAAPCLIVYLYVVGVREWPCVPFVWVSLDFRLRELPRWVQTARMSNQMPLRGSCEITALKSTQNKAFSNHTQQRSKQKRALQSSKLHPDLSRSPILRCTVFRAGGLFPEDPLLPKGCKERPLLASKASSPRQCTLSPSPPSAGPRSGVRRNSGTTTLSRTETSPPHPHTHHPIPHTLPL